MSSRFMTPPSYYEVEQSNHYKKWQLYFNPFLTKLYNKLIDILKYYKVSYSYYSFESFSMMMYKNSSKRIPLY
jgi:hypothetical protein